MYAYLASCPNVVVLPPDLEQRADVLLSVTHEVDDELIGWMAQLAAGREENLPRHILVSTALSEKQAIRAVSHGLVAFMPRDCATLPEVVRALTAAVSGHAHMPTELIRSLTEEIRRLESGKPTDLASGFSEREIDVLRLFAEGFDTADVASKLCYSERTIKNVVHHLTKRLGLRNRTHAVAYGVRLGVL
ncbi:response regulator transcription factor (plasmid) [Streptomyces sp. AHU1]|uniref:helix-turn-helix transcriptional regulator n=1 Tax=Streptomyces sp. AHU1 TaxID=3377215 RepID=UPI0038780C65